MSEREQQKAPCVRYREGVCGVTVCGGGSLRGGYTPVDLKKPVVGGAVIVVVSGSAVEGRFPFGDAYHGADGVGREASFSQVPSDGTRALSRKLGLRGLDGRASRAGEDGGGKAGSICGGHAGRTDCTANAPSAGLG